MTRYAILLLPYALQLLCLVHAVKTRRDTFWIWIIIMVPYAGGVAYAIVEILPGLASRRRVDRVIDTVVDIVKPDRRLEELRLRAETSSTFKNVAEYAAGLQAAGRHAEALDILLSQDVGVFKGDPELSRAVAASLHALGRDAEALERVSTLRRPGSRAFERIADDLLYLSIVERTMDEAAAKAEYRSVMAAKQDGRIDFQFIRFLAAVGDREGLREMFDKARSDERAMRLYRTRYDRGFYRGIYRFEAELNRKNKNF